MLTAHGVPLDWPGWKGTFDEPRLKVLTAQLKAKNDRRPPPPPPRLPGLAGEIATAFLAGLPPKQELRPCLWEQSTEGSSRQSTPIYREDEHVYDFELFEDECPPPSTSGAYACIEQLMMYLRRYVYRSPAHFLPYDMGFGSHREHGVHDMFVPPLPKDVKDYKYCIPFRSRTHWGLPDGVALAELFTAPVLVQDTEPVWTPPAHVDRFILHIAWPQHVRKEYEIPLTCYHGQISIHSLAFIIAAFAMQYFDRYSFCKWRDLCLGDPKNFRQLRLVALWSDNEVDWYAEIGYVDPNPPELRYKYALDAPYP
ncbi:hypothetical protein HGRIS_000996 [Hohenbuehelia grisea]|uniref:Uncharacterized protein n=1 Tax=Hohenbuehelia grisea TaxID=104357 RepID=A0ABR3IQD4_9AGAR